MLKEGAKVVQSGRQIAIQAGSFLPRLGKVGAVGLQSHSQTTRPPLVLGKDARPDQTRLTVFNLSAQGGVRQTTWVPDRRDTRVRCRTQHRQNV